MQSTNITHQTGSSNERDEEEQQTQLKKLRRQAKNRESVRKCQMRKKAYIHELEQRNLKLIELEKKNQTFQKQFMSMEKGIVCHQGQPDFAEVYNAWTVEHNQILLSLRQQLLHDSTDKQIVPYIDNVLKNFNKLFKLKELAAKNDVFNIIHGSWMTTIERSMSWVGGFRSSQLLKLLMNHLELTISQQNKMDELKTSTIQEEGNLSSAIYKLQDTIVDTLASNALVDKGDLTMESTYMSHMYIAIGKLSVMENFMIQGNQLRENTLQQIREILTVKQSALAYLAIHDYFQRIVALSKLWENRQKP